MNEEVFGIENFNLISDDKYYYVFRALNRKDKKETDDSLTKEDNELQKLTTNKQRYPENDRYNDVSQISLKEVFEHTRSINAYKGTNCISLSSNANISIDYGSRYGHKYIMVKIPKDKDNQFYNAGQYMISELNKMLDKKLKELPLDSKIIQLIKEIESKTDKIEIQELIGERFKGYNTKQGKLNSNSRLRTKTAITDRFRKRQAFSKDQDLEYAKLMGKMTILELEGLLPRELLEEINISSLTSTIGSELSNREFIHYGEMSSDEFVTISRLNVDMFAMLQTALEKGVDSSKIKEIERKIIEYTNQGYELLEKDGKLYYSNGTNEINLNLDSNSILSKQDILQAPSELSIEELFEKTDGQISYMRAKMANEFVHNLSIAQRKTIEIGKVLKTILGNDELTPIIDEIVQKTIAINDRIITRKNGRGMQVSESVNIDINRGERRIFSDKEQRGIYDEIKVLSVEKLDSIISEEGKEIEQRIYLSNLEKRETDNNKSKEERLNRYYAETIVDTLDISKIYRKAIRNKDLNEEERENLIKLLESSDCKSLVQAFTKAGIKESDVAGYIINLLASNGYQGHTLEELSRLEELDEIIAKNIKNANLKGHVYPSVMENLRGIKDNANLVEGTTLKLRDYQQEAIDNIDIIYESGKRFAGVVLPTGAGKSFIAMTEMLKNQNGNILYIAPQQEILYQVQRHILKNIAKVEILTSEEIERLKEEQQVSNAKNLILPDGKILPTQAGEYVKKVFPHLKMLCYQGLSAQKDEELSQEQREERDSEEKELREILKNADANLIVFDELHRSGAKTWKGVVEQLIETNKNANILGITATPIRDTDHVDMMNELASMTKTYTQEELATKQYLGYEMYLIDAIQRGLVVEPNIISFDFMLRDTDEYQEIVEMISTEKNPEKKRQLIEIKEQIDELISGETEITEHIKNNISKKENEEIGRIIRETIKQKDGRYIVFLPQHSSSDGLNETEYFEQQEQKIREILASIDAEPEISRLSSADSKAQNRKAITDFENSNSKHLKIMLAINKLNEGVHIDGINGEIMYRKINDGSTILYLQQLGRVIFSIDPDKPVPNELIPIVYDIYNNYLVQNLNRTVNQTTPKSDLQKLKEVIEWIDKHGYEPDINSEDIQEARKAITLKKIQNKYKKYLDGIDNPRLSKSDIYEIEQIMELAKSIDLFSKDIGTRIIPPGEKDLSEVQLFKVTATQKKFSELYKKANKVVGNTVRHKNNYTARLNDIMTILDVLNSNDIFVDNNLIQYSDTLKDVIEKCPEELKQILLEELSDFEEEYPIGKEFNYAKTAFRDKKTWSYFKELDIKKIYAYGICEDIDLDYAKNEIKSNDDKIKLTQKVLKNDFIIYGPIIFGKLNVKTGTYYDEEGYNIDGYNNEGYDREGFNKLNVDKLGFYKNSEYNKYGFRRDGYNERTNSYFDEHGFDIEGTYWAPNPEFPNDFSNRINTYKKINEYGFDRDGDWYKEDENGNLIYAGTVDELGFVAFEETNSYGFRRDGINNETGELWDRHGFLMNKTHKDTGEVFDPHGFRINGLYKDTTKYTDPRHFDIDHFFHYTNGRSHWNTYTYYDEEGRDIDGWDINGVDENGIEHFTIPVNERGFNQKRINILTLSMVDENELDYDGYRWKKRGREYIKTDSIYGKDGFSVEGLDAEGYRRDGINIYTNSPANKDGFDKEGYFWRKDKDGIYVKTDSKYGDDGYNKEGYDRYNFDRNHMILIESDGYDKVYDVKEGKEVYAKQYYSYTNKYGFNYQRIHKNGTLYDDNDFDIEGINKDTGEVVNKNQFNRDLEFCEKNSEGEWVSTGEKYNNEGLDFFGNYHKILKNGMRDENTSGLYGDDGYNKEGFDQEGYDRKGYNLNGINKRRFNKEQLYVNKDGTTSKVNPRGFGYDGYIYEYDENAGEYVKTDRLYDDEGYDIDELNIDKFDRDFKYMHKSTINDYGFNYFHRWKDGSKYDNHGFDFYGINKETGKKYDTHYFDRDGYLYVYDKETGEYIKTENKINTENFDIDGYYYEQLYDYNNKRLSNNKLQEIGIMEDTWTNKYRTIYRKKTEYKTNPAGIDIDGKYHEDEVRDPSILNSIKEQKKDEQKRKESLKKHEERMKKEEEKRAEKRKQKEEFARQVELKKQEELQIKKEDFESKFDEEGICKTTNLPYDENFFNKAQINTITGRVVNSRGFNCFGECVRNEGKKYDRNGFKIDGTHYLTGEKYYKGYNAYDVDKDGKTREGKIHLDIIIARTYIKECLNGTSKKQFITKYSNRLGYITRNKALTENDIKSAMRNLKIKIFDAAEMYPPFKEELQKMIEKTKNQIRARTSRYIMLRKNSAQNKEEIEKLQKELAILKDRLDSVSMGEK